MTRVGVRGLGRGVTALALTLATVGLAQAAPIPLNLSPSTPDIAVGSIELTYTGGTLTASSSAPMLYTPGGDVILDGSYWLSASIDAAGNLLGPGLVTISGFHTGFLQPLSLTATLNEFGFNAQGVGLLEFRGVVTEDVSAGYGVGTSFGVIMNSQLLNINFLSDFQQDSWAGVTADNAVLVPEPATLSLFALGVLGYVMVRRRRRG
jgi:hypothetical protein